MSRKEFCNPDEADNKFLHNSGIYLLQYTGVKVHKILNSTSWKFTILSDTKKIV